MERRLPYSRPQMREESWFYQSAYLQSCPKNWNSTNDVARLAMAEMAVPPKNAISAVALPMAGRESGTEAAEP
jgi:hypothetical protein